jgi:hypothetical protein
LNDPLIAKTKSPKDELRISSEYSIGSVMESAGEEEVQVELKGVGWSRLIRPRNGAAIGMKLPRNA